jgi:hypothetical protein
MDAVTAEIIKLVQSAAGVANGINLVSTPQYTVASTEMIFVNGVLQQRGAVTITKLLGLQLLSRLETTAHCQM